MLRRCGLLIQAVEISHLMTNSHGADDDNRVGITYACRSCSSLDPVTPRVTGSLYCDQCRAPIGVKCVYCSLMVRGHVVLCLVCGHGGHLAHMEEYFGEYDKCGAPSCDCECLEYIE